MSACNSMLKHIQFRLNYGIISSASAILIKTNSGVARVIYITVFTFIVKH